MMKRALIYGAAIAVAGVLLTALIAAAGLEANQAVGYLGLLFPVIGIVLAIRAAKRDETGEFTFGEGFKQGALVTVVAAVLGALLGYLYLTAVNPGYLDAVREATTAQLESQGYSGRELAQAQAMTESMANPGAVAAIGFITQLIFGLIVSALAALFMRRKAAPGQHG